MITLSIQCAHVRLAAHPPARARTPTPQQQTSTQLWAVVGQGKPLKLDFSGPKFAPPAAKDRARDVHGNVSQYWGDPGACCVVL